MQEIGFTRRGCRAMQPPSRQAGITTLGFVILAAFVGTFAFGAIRLMPVYLNYFKVVSVVEGVRTEFEGTRPSIGSIRSSIARRFEVESVSEITARDVTVTPADGGYEVACVYDHTAPFIGNISFKVHFDKKVLVRR